MPNVTITAADGGHFSAYLSLPTNVSGKVPGIVMMQQIFGANAEMRGFTDDYAAQGYVAICPDLFWRLEPSVEIDPLAPDGFQKALTYAPRFNADQGVEDLKAAVAFLRAHPACNSKIGTVGYCLGGTIAIAAASLLPCAALATIAAPWFFRAYPESFRSGTHQASGLSFDERAQTQHPDPSGAAHGEKSLCRG